MRHIKEWMNVSEMVNVILAKDPHNDIAAKVRNIAGMALIDDGYPCDMDGNQKKLTVGAYTFEVSDVKEDQTVSKEIADAYTEQIKGLNAKITAQKAKIKELGKHIRACQEILGQAVDVKVEEPVEDEFEELSDLDEIDGLEEIADEEEPISEEPAEEAPSVVEEPVDEPQQADPAVEEKEPADDAETEVLSRKQPAPKPEPADDAETEVLNRKPPVKQEEAPVAPQPVAENANNERPLPSDPFSGYKDHLQKQDIVFSYHQIAIKQDDSSIITRVEVVVSPLTMEEGESRIMAWASNGIRHEARISQTMRKSVLLQVGDIPLIVTGSVHDGRFMGHIETTKRMLSNGISIDVQDTAFGGVGHVLLNDDNIEVRVVPLTMANRRSGSAEFFYAIVQKDQEPIVGDNSDEDGIRFKFQGNQMELLARWKNDTLYGAVRIIG